MRFGSFNNAIRAAGYEPNSSPPRPYVKWKDEDLLQRLNGFVHDLGYVPTLIDLQNNRQKGMADYATYIHRFGSIEAALKKSGIRFSVWRYRLLGWLRWLHKGLAWLGNKLRQPVR
jgi:hypothetical protein